MAWPHFVKTKAGSIPAHSPKGETISGSGKKKEGTNLCFCPPPEDHA
ncbi:MAG: hypothetical protein ACOCN7_06925 [Prevotella sp.]